MEERGNIRSRIFEIGGSADSSLLRLLEWLPNSDIHKSDAAYRMYEWLHQHKHMIGKRGVVNRSGQGLAFQFAEQPEQDTYADKARREEPGYADTPVGDSA